MRRDLHLTMAPNDTISNSSIDTGKKKKRATNLKRLYRKYSAIKRISCPCSVLDPRIFAPSPITRTPQSACTRCELCSAETKPTRKAY
jgi:hypothetical protein